MIDKDDFSAVPGGEITLQDIKTKMQAIRTAQEYVRDNIDRNSREYKAMQDVIMLAIEQLADIAEEKGFDDIAELEDGLNSDDFIVLHYRKGGAV